jgi:hypothetical protein
MTEPFVVPYNAADSCLLSGGNWHPDYPLSRLLTADVASVARAAASTWSSTCFLCNSNILPQPVRLAAFVNHDLTGPGYEGLPDYLATKWRVRTISGGPGGDVKSFTCKATPAVISGSANLNVSAGVAATQDIDPEIPLGSWLTANVSTLNTVLSVAFDPVGQCGLKVGTDLQIMRFRVRKKGGATAPTVTPEILVGGIVRQTGTPVTVTTTGDGELITFLWDAANLQGGPPPPTSGVTLRLTGTASANATVEYKSVEWSPDFASTTEAFVTDSGWMDPVLPLGYFTPPKRFENLYLRYIFPSGTYWDQMFFEFKALANESGLNLGRLVIGDAIQFEDPSGADASIEAGIRFRRVDPSIKERINGHLAVEAMQTYREMTLAWPALSRASALDQGAGYLFRYLGTTRSAYWVTAPDEPERINETDIYGLLKELPELEGIPTSPQGFTCSMTIEEDI